MCDEHIDPFMHSWLAEKVVCFFRMRSSFLLFSLLLFSPPSPCRPTWCTRFSAAFPVQCRCVRPNSPPFIHILLFLPHALSPDSSPPIPQSSIPPSQIHRNEVEASSWHCTLARLYMTKRTATSSADSLMNATTAIDIRERCCGQDDERTVQARQLLACHYRTHGDASHALAALESVLQSRTRALGEAHPLTLAAMNDVAGLWLQMGMKAEAEEMLSNTLALRRTWLGNAHADTAVSIHNLASFLVQERRWAQGLALFTELEAWRAEHLGRESKEYLSTVNNVAVCLDKMEKFDEVRWGAGARCRGIVFCLQRVSDFLVTNLSNIPLPPPPPGLRQVRAVHRDANRRARHRGPHHPAYHEQPGLPVRQNAAAAQGL